jgi:hypothetical protein
VGGCGLGGDEAGGWAEDTKVSICVDEKTRADRRPQYDNEPCTNASPRSTPSPPSACITSLNAAKNWPPVSVSDGPKFG